MSKATNPIQQVDLKPSQLVPHASNIRSEVGDITGLTASIVAQGVLQPLTVVPNGKPDRYVIIAGHRRHAAATAGKLETVPCVVRHDLTDEADQIAAMIAENVERADLTPVEEARGVMALFDLGESPNSIAARTGMSIKRIRVRKKIGNLSDDVKARITEHKLSLDDAAFLADHAGNANDLAALENALGTNNWAVAKQQQLDRVAERKRVAAIRKDAEAAGFEVVTDWARHREITAEAAKTLNVSAADIDNGRKEFVWPVAPEVLAQAQSENTVAFLHIATSKSLVVGGKWVSEMLVVLSAQSSTPVADGQESTEITSPAGDDNAEPAPSPTEADAAGTRTERREAAERETQERRDALKAAATVRTEWVRDLIATGDDEAAKKATAVVARESRWGFGEFEFADAWPFLRGVNAAPPVPLDEAVREWFATSKPASVLLAVLWTTIFHEPAQILGHGHLDNSEPDELKFVLAYGEMLADLGYVLSDVEAGVLDSARAQIAAEEAGDED
ncbi:ParB-like partition protein [Gordonia phage Schnabeltier]|uniref:ParB-like nuclease domain protein n=1 Tax=Gordonia phage Schnabeltier TaxID=1821561 RepID=A0A142KA42_9CAUD|nr:ParB-like partition protein [Gordonia phage Schnabeltier]AMS02975.1 ParB-like nuclease domain protein [Gordonia phage Schnabeltier]